MVIRELYPVKRDRKEEAKQKWTVEAYVAYVCGAPDKEGRELWWRCPLHSEDTPSFAVNPDKQLWSCQGCHAGGGLFDFVMQYHKVEFKGALDILLGEITPTYVPRPAPKAPDLRVQRLSPPLSLGIVKEHHALYEASGLDYWSRCGFSQATISEQLLGMYTGTRKFLLSDGEWVSFPWRRFTIPYWSGTSVKSLNARLDTDYVKERISGPDKDAFEMACFTLNEQRVSEGKRPDITPERAVDILFGAKYMRYKDGASETFPYYNINLLWERDSAGQIVTAPGENRPALYWWDTMIVVEGEKKALALVENGYPAIYLKHHAKVNFAWLFGQCNRVVILADGDDAGRLQATLLQEKIGKRAIIAYPLRGFKGADDMIDAYKIDVWAQKYNVLPYFEPRSRKGGRWSPAPLYPRTI